MVKLHFCTLLLYLLIQLVGKHVLKTAGFWCHEIFLIRLGDLFPENMELTQNLS